MQIMDALTFSSIVGTGVPVSLADHISESTETRREGDLDPRLGLPLSHCISLVRACEVASNMVHPIKRAISTPQTTVARIRFRCSRVIDGTDQRQREPEKLVVFGQLLDLDQESWLHST